MRNVMMLAAMITIAAGEFVRRLTGRDDLTEGQRERLDKVAGLPPTLPITIDQSQFPAEAFGDVVTPREPKAPRDDDGEPPGDLATGEPSDAPETPANTESATKPKHLTSSVQ